MTELDETAARVWTRVRANAVACTLLACCSVVAVAESTRDAKKVWSGEGELGFALTEGNTETKNINVGIKLDQVLTDWENAYVIEALNESQNDVTSAEKYAVKLQTNRKLSAENFLFGALTYDDDRFSGFDYEVAISTGYGRRLIGTDDMQLDAEIGPGYRFTKVRDVASILTPTLATRQADEEEAILRTAFRFRYDFTKHSRFTQSLTSTAGDSRVITELESSVTAQVVGNLAMKLSLKVKHNSEPADVTREKTDTETAFTLVYGF
jgi:putative salt-induced outer membrane protein YdiY